jgi:hypothetical protein
MPPFGFTDDELNSITALASPLPAAVRGDFLQACRRPACRIPAASARRRSRAPGRTEP